jgi:hypothetical protein
LAKHAQAAMKALISTSADDLECVENGDENSKLVFVASNKTVAVPDKIIVK